MNLPIEQLIEALNALTQATERNSAIAQKALDLHLSAASHLPTGIEQSVIEPAKKTRAKKADTPPPDVTRDEALAAHTEMVMLPVEETTETPEPEPVVEPEAPTPAPQPTEPPVTVEMIRKYIGDHMIPVVNAVNDDERDFITSHNAAVTAKVKEINSEFGAARIPDVPTERLAEYLTVLKRWIPLNK